MVTQYVVIEVDRDGTVMEDVFDDAGEALRYMWERQDMEPDHAFTAEVRGDS